VPGERPTDGVVVGVDAGSTQVKAVLLTRRGDVVCTFIRPTTGRVADAAAAAIAQLLVKAGVDRGAVMKTGVTGYGRKSVVSDTVATEIMCHARGVSCFFRKPATVIDVGGPDSKVILTDGSGRVVFWSDARFCWNPDERADAQADVPHQDVRPAKGPVRCALWFGGSYDAQGRPYEALVWLGGHLQRRSPQRW